MTTKLVDPRGLLTALVLAPGTYPRNRFLELYKDAEMKRVRRRAAQLRGLVRQLAGRAGITASQIETMPHEDGGRTVRYRVDALTMRAEVTLDPLEAAILDVALARAHDREAPAEAKAMVESALAPLAELRAADEAKG